MEHVATGCQAAGSRLPKLRAIAILQETDVSLQITSVLLRSSPVPTESLGHRLRRRRLTDLAAHGLRDRYGQGYERQTVKIECRLFQMT
jgi:hypothetical protein